MGTHGPHRLCVGVHTRTPPRLTIQSVHELSVCQALLTQVAEIAAGRGARMVERITIEVGPLCGVEPALLARAFVIARAGGCAAEAALLIESTSVTVSCVGCGAQSQVAPNRLICAMCGGFRTRVVAGDELRLRRVELRMPESRSPVV
jgi:hydrogenase nickel incorporation protein HypA/HybF